MQQLSEARPAQQVEVQASAAVVVPQRRVARWQRLSPALRQTILLFGATRLLFVLVTYVGYVLFNAGSYSLASVGMGNLLLSWDHWDARWYLGIAQYGYYKPDLTLSAFFPLYPLIVKLVALPLVGLGSVGFYVAGLLVANVAFFFALWALRVLAERECGPEAAARAAVYLALFPTALYFFAPYNESLFLFLTISCFLALRRARWWLAGTLGLLAMLTRSEGIVLVVPFTLEYLRAHDRDWRRWRLDALAVGLIPTGLALYSVYSWFQFDHHPLAFMHAQVGWGRFLAWPWMGIWQQMVDLWHVAAASFFQAHDLLDLGAALGFLALVALGWRRLPLSYSMYATAQLLLVLLVPVAPATHFLDPLESDQRFVLEIFPAFLTLGLLVRRPAIHQALISVFSGLLAVLSLVFITGRWLV